MPKLKIQLLGAPQVSLNGQRLAFDSRKSLALLAYIASTSRPHTRDSLTDLFWPDAAPKRARGSLRTALAYIKKQLDGPWLHTAQDTVTFAPDKDAWVDVLHFRQLLAENHQQGQTPSEADPAQGDDVRCLSDAVDLYAGDFLAGFSLRDSPDFDDWQLFERENLRRELVHALQSLASISAKQHKVDPAIQYARRWLQVEPYDEAAHQTLIRTYTDAGQWANAQRQYEACVHLLEQELGVPPAPETVALLEAIRTRQPVPSQQALDLQVRQFVGKPNRAAAQPVPTIRTHTLPLPSSSFVGRQTELDDLAHYLAKPTIRLVTLVGIGGIGKTRLAMAAAETHLAVFAHGVYFVPLAAITTAAQVVSAMANALNFALRDGSDPTAQLLAYLKKREVLMILDSVEQLLVKPEAEETGTGIRSLFQALLQQTTQVRLLVTSREALHLQSEYCYPVRGLHWPDDATSQPDSDVDYAAITLFLQRVRQAHPTLTDDEMGEIRQICGLVEGMPLAIELAAALSGTLPLSEIGQYLGESREMPDVEQQGVDERHRSIHAVFDVSWRTLVVQEQRVFARLSLFCGGFTLDAACHVARATPEILSNLVRKSLLRLMAGRYEMHPLIQSYAAARLAEEMDDKAFTQARHSAYFGDLVRTQMGQWQKAYDRMTIEEVAKEGENILAGWQWLLTQSEVSSQDDYLEHLWRFYQASGRLPEAITVLQQSLAQLEEQEAGTFLFLRAQWSYLLGEAYYRLGQLAASNHLLHESLRLLAWPVPTTIYGIVPAITREIMQQSWYRIRSHHQPSANPAYSIAARSYSRLAQIGYLHNSAIWVTYFVLRALNAAEQTALEPVRAVAYASMGLLCGTATRHRLARFYLSEAEAVAQRLADRPTLAAAAMRHGVYRLSTGQWAQARTQLENSLHLHEEVGDWRNVGDCLTLLNTITISTGEFQASIAYSKRLSDLATRTQNVEHRVWSALIQAISVVRLGEPDKAILQLTEAIPLYAQMNTPEIGHAASHSILAVAHYRQGNLAAAWQSAQSAQELFGRRLPTSITLLYGLYRILEVYLTLWEETQSASSAIEFTEQQLKSNIQKTLAMLRKAVWMHPVARPYVAFYGGRFDWLNGSQRHAHRRWQKALAEAQMLDIPRLVALIHYEMGRHLPPSNQNRAEHLQQAVDIYEELAMSYELILAHRELAKTV